MTQKKKTGITRQLSPKMLTMSTNIDVSNIIQELVIFNTEIEKIPACKSLFEICIKTPYCRQGCRPVK